METPSADESGRSNPALRAVGEREALRGPCFNPGLPLLRRFRSMAEVRRVQDGAHAFWVRAPGCGEIRPVTLPEPGRDDVVVRTVRSGVSRGTETLVFRGGGVPIGPEGVPPARAVLAGIVETAVNALWDAAPLVGDRVTVVGAGMVGCCVARLLARFPAVEVTLVDVDESRAEVAAALGAGFGRPGRAPGGCDLVVHTSATSAGLQRSLDLLAPEATVLDLSWYGDTEVRLSLGGAFHSGRLGVRASQVGTVARPDRTAADRLAPALDLLPD